MTAQAAEWPADHRAPPDGDHLTINILHPKTPLQKRVRSIKYSRDMAVADQAALRRVAKRDDKLSKYDFAADDWRLYEWHAEAVEKGGSW
jgi:hypothetical protein